MPPPQQRKKGWTHLHKCEEYADVFQHSQICAFLVPQGQPVNQPETGLTNVI